MRIIEFDAESNQAFEQMSECPDFPGPVTALRVDIYIPNSTWQDYAVLL